MSAPSTSSIVTLSIFLQITEEVMAIGKEEDDNAFFSMNKEIKLFVGRDYFLILKVSIATDWVGHCDSDHILLAAIKPYRVPISTVVIHHLLPHCVETASSTAERPTSVGRIVRLRGRG